MSKRGSTAKQTRARRANLVKARASRWSGSRRMTAARKGGGKKLIVKGPFKNKS